MQALRAAMLRITPESNHPMGDKKGKQDRAKAQRQQKAKQVKAAKKKQDKQPPRPL